MSHRVRVKGIFDTSCFLRGAELHQKDFWSVGSCYEIFCGHFAEAPVSKPEQFIELTSPFLCGVKINDGQKPELYVPWMSPPAPASSFFKR